MSKQKRRQRRYSPRGQKTQRALYLIGLLGFATVRQLCLLVWENERTTNDALNRLLDNHFLDAAYEAVELSLGRGNRLVFLTKTGLSWILKNGHLREEDIAFCWKGEGHWSPQYNAHNVLVHDVLCAFIKQAGDHPEGSMDLRLDPAVLAEEVIEATSPLQTHALIPDRIFAVKSEQGVLECYLEVDCGTEDQKQWRAKMEKYMHSPEVMDGEGVVVLTVAHTQRRMETLLRWSADLVTNRYLFSYVDAICYTYERQEKTLTLSSAGNPFGSVWHRVSDDDLHTLFWNE